ncbi:hypothetical protein ERJ70_06935 [Sediminibacillus dalangtanensis]|uniref:FAD/FMN-containing dehydrogenase n=1 Tax=Sediminibacillus dalangtanensis TaxID=2729421 RepID=A0ABX7VUB0_9BACI|nr:hypothetical protein [Sediminibacillus dalangtanensis]QTM99058.1 hypothetical protein ERJ70_06935 [Sediminibacillus dalangtanensis]
MRKMLLSGAITLILVLGIGNIVFAHDGGNGWSFTEMLPMMKEMHPSFNDEQLEQMYQDCHGNGDENNKVMKNL